MGNTREPFEPDTIYHLYNHGNGSDLIFREDENYRFFLERFRFYISPIADVYAYCLMPNHFHFLVRVAREDELMAFFKEMYPIGDRSAMSLSDIADLDFADFISKQFKNFLISYSKSFNKMYNRRGSLFLDNIQRIKVADDDYFTTMIRYIHFNPVLHGFTKTLFQWKYISIHAFYTEKRSLLKTKDVIDWFGGLEPFKQFHQLIQEDEFDKIKHLTLE